ncbi:MAG: hypothetical protein JWO85_491 [Candidatus Eremiobacteraeota bacterium]|nr:hypothetical protein [Candidatus Eremiobacteraeota bacterium]
MGSNVRALGETPIGLSLRRFLNKDFLIAVALFVAAVITLTNLKLAMVNEFQGDSALFFQMTDNIAERGLPVSNVFENILTVAGGQTFSRTAAQLATDPLTPTSVAEGNVFGLHAYYIMYPLSLLAKIVPTRVLLMGLFALAFMGVPLVAYLWLRRRGIPILAAVLFCLVVTAHPSWSEGILNGQFYPDRLYVLLGFAFMCLIAREGTPRSWQLTAAVLGALVTERAAIVSGIFVVLYVALYWRRPSLDRYFKLGLAAGLLLYGFFVLKFGIIGTSSAQAYSQFLPGSAAAVAANFHNPAFAAKALVFVLVNAIFLIVALFEWRAAIIAAILMLPNLLGSIGGAEKTGWSTHYHDLYLPALLWAAMLGYRVAYRRAESAKLTGAVYAGGLAMVLLSGLIDPYAFAPMKIGLSNIANLFPFQFSRDAAANLGANGDALRAYHAGVSAAVPEGSIVSTPESTMADVYSHRTVRFFPVGIDTADYAVLSIAGTTPSGQPLYGGALSFLGAAEQAKINAMVVARMKRDHYDFTHPVLIPALGVAIVSRVDGRTRRAAAGIPTAAKAPAAAPSTIAAAASPSLPRLPVARTYRKPSAPARIVQHGHTVAATGIDRSTDLTGALAAKPKAGDLILAFASAGFGCVVAPGWNLLGTNPSTSTAVAYRIAQPGDGATFVPFTTPTANSYTLELVEIAGGPDIIGSPQSGGGFVLEPTITNKFSLGIPQTGGVLFQLYAWAGGNGAPTRFRSTFPPGQKQSLVDRVPPYGNAFELVVEATTTDPRKAAQPFVGQQTVTFAKHDAPGNIAAGWLVWVGGKTI